MACTWDQNIGCTCKQTQLYLWIAPTSGGFGHILISTRGEILEVPKSCDKNGISYQNQSKKKKGMSLTPIPHYGLFRKQKYIWIFHNFSTLIHWGRVTHICISKLTIIGSDYGLSPEWRQAIIWSNARILSIITTWRGITCRIAVTIEGVENTYLPGNVHFQYRP